VERVYDEEYVLRRGRVAVVDGRSAAERLARAIKENFERQTYIAEAGDEGSIAYAVQVEGVEGHGEGDLRVRDIRNFAAGYLACLRLNAVYEHLASVEVVYESAFLRAAIGNAFRPEAAAEILERIGHAYRTAKESAGVRR